MFLTMERPEIKFGKRQFCMFNCKAFGHFNGEINGKNVKGIT